MINNGKCYICNKRINRKGSEYELLIKVTIRSICEECYKKTKKKQRNKTL